MAKKRPMIEGHFPEKPSEYLKFEFEMRKRRNSSYSIRAFARDLSLSPSHLSEFLSGKSSLSEKKVESLSKKLKLPETHKEHWLDLLQVDSKIPAQRDVAKAKVSRRLKESKSSVSLDVFKVISDWYHFAILSFFGANNFFSERELKNHLGISLAKVRAAIARLLELELLDEVDQGYRPSTETSFTEDGIPSLALREAQRQALSLAAMSLEVHSVKERKNQSLFFSLPKKDVDQFRKTLNQRILETVVEFSKEDLEKEELSVELLTWHTFPISKKLEVEG
ncbi:TIGR02147 family protein [bacterium]|nr:TIGR02147 family protein [bacterium]